MVLNFTEISLQASPSIDKFLLYGGIFHIISGSKDCLICILLFWFGPKKHNLSYESNKFSGYL